jgi:glycerol kinase
VHVTDASNASRTNLLELGSRQWHAPTVELFGLDPGMLPRVASNSEVVGRVKAGPLAGVAISGAMGGPGATGGRAALVGFSMVRRHRERTDCGRGLGDEG